MLHKLEERAWISRCRLLGDERAFAKLMERYQGRVLRFFLLQTGGNQDDSDDLAQETFIKVWRHMDSLEQFSNFSTWLYRIAYRVFLDYTRGHTLLEEMDDERVPDREFSPDASSALNQEERSRVIQTALNQLPEQERTSMVLYYLQELNVHEIAQITSYSESSIRCYLSRGREKLKNHPTLKDYLYDER